MSDLTENLCGKIIENLEKYNLSAEVFFTDGTSLDASVSGTEEAWINVDKDDLIGKTIASAEITETSLELKFDDGSSASIDASGTEFSWLSVSGCNL